jgi:uncharacterized protein (DUF1800 family)
MTRVRSSVGQRGNLSNLLLWCAAACAGMIVALSAVPFAAADNSIAADQQILHVLDRLGYGPRPGDVERVKQIGLTNYLQQQLHPERIDDSAVNKKLAPFDALSMSASNLMASMHEDQRMAAERKKARAEAENTRTNSQPAEAKQRDTKIRKLAEEKAGQHLSRIAVAQLQEAKIIRAVESNRQLYEVLVDFWSNHFNIDVRKGPCRVLKVVDERDVIRPNVFGKFRDLLEASAKSPAMLFYLDNAQNTVAREMGPGEERARARIRKQVPGAVPDPAPTDGKPRTVGGINENYAREIMELHTLGVDGGYTQKDVQEVARCFTGWGINLQTGAFEFHARRHDDGAKMVLGHAIPPGGGKKDVEMVLDILARHPSTAKFIATKLCQRLVTDDPPSALVDRVAGVFRATDGDLRKVTEAIIYSPEFYSPAAYRAKIKSPFEFAVSAVRAAGGTLTVETTVRPPLSTRLAMETGATFGRGMERFATARRKTLNLSIIELGQPLFAHQAPTGYPEDSRKWVNTGALIARMNFSLSLAEGNLIDVRLVPENLVSGVDIDKPELVLNRLNQVLLQGRMSDATRATLEKQTVDTHGGEASTINVPQLAALMLGSPEFQRH